MAKNSNNEKVMAFKKELKALLEKYNAYIGFSVSSCSDTYGLYDEEMKASFGNENSFTLAEGWGIDASDLNR